MTTRESMALIGRLGLLREGRGITYEVKVLDVKVGWGRTRLLVQPTAGVGEAWIEEESIVLARLGTQEDKLLDAINRNFDGRSS